MTDAKELKVFFLEAASDMQNGYKTAMSEKALRQLKIGSILEENKDSMIEAFHGVRNSMAPGTPAIETIETLIEELCK